MAQTEVDGVLYRFGIFALSRSRCDWCVPKNENKQDTVLVRIRVPQKEELRICYSCLIKQMTALKRRRDKITAATEKARRIKAEQAAKKAEIAERVRAKKAKEKPVTQEDAHRRAQEKIKREAEKRIEKLKGVKNGTGVLPQTVADVQGGTPPPAKENERAGNEVRAGAAIECGIVSLEENQGAGER